MRTQTTVTRPRKSRGGNDRAGTDWLTTRLPQVAHIAHSSNRTNGRRYPMNDVPAFEVPRLPTASSAVASDPPSSWPRRMRGALMPLLKILISAALLFFALRKIDFHTLASRLDLGSLGWIGLAVLIALLQVGLGGLRWREIAAQCGIALTAQQAVRYTLIGTFFNQTLPSSIGGDAMRVWLVQRGNAGWRPATYSVIVDRAG
jgi:Lysylphosphatidylglycerol synthase TM region